MTYETVAGFTQSLALIFFLSVFLLAVVYALWPSNRRVFEHAARMPLDGDKPLGSIRAGDAREGDNNV